ncbi:MAG: FlgD immunoglobulin-like domain containing protein, partial [Candidatus Poribacteria bacterium]
IYNVKGQLIRILRLGEQKAGIYLSKDRAAYWDGRDSAGEKVGSGIYFYTLQVGDDFKATRRMVILK